MIPVHRGRDPYIYVMFVIRCLLDCAYYLFDSLPASREWVIENHGLLLSTLPQVYTFNLALCLQMMSVRGVDVSSCRRT